MSSSAVPLTRCISLYRERESYIAAAKPRAKSTPIESGETVDSLLSLYYIYMMGDMVSYLADEYYYLDRMQGKKNNNSNNKGKKRALQVSNE